MFAEMNWYGVKQNDFRVVNLYSMHYSSERSSAGRTKWLRHGITGPGETMTLITSDARALFLWIKQVDRDDGQKGVNCGVFRNIGQQQSSTLILEAMDLAWQRWPNERLFTYVDPGRVKSSNPGYCFKMAGWQTAGKSKRRKLHLLEVLPAAAMRKVA